jgi:hypothetical protein
MTIIATIELAAESIRSTFKSKNIDMRLRHPAVEATFMPSLHSAIHEFIIDRGPSAALFLLSRLGIGHPAVSVLLQTEA